MKMSILEVLSSRKTEMDSAMRDIESQQRELDDMRARVEGRLFEIEYMIRHLGDGDTQ